MQRGAAGDTGELQGGLMVGLGGTVQHCMIPVGVEGWVREAKHLEGGAQQGWRRGGEAALVLRVLKGSVHCAALEGAVWQSHRAA